MVHQRSLSKRASARSLRRSPRGPERLERRHGLVGQLPGAAAAAVDAQKPGVRPFAQLGILADALAQLGLVALDVEQVVDDLKRQTHGLAVTVQRLDADLRGPGDHGPHLQRGSQQRPGLAAVDRLERRERRRRLGRRAPSLPDLTRSALRPGGRPSGRPPCPTARPPRPGSARTRAPPTAA